MKVGFVMVLIRFTDPQVEKKALGFLARRFSLKTWASCETLVPEAALEALKAEGIGFTVEGKAAYDRRGSIVTRSYCR
jgi:hypothetical protein